MLPSTENLINELPVPIKEAIEAAVKYNTSYSSWSFTMDEHKLYFALKDLKEWLERPKYGESMFKKFFKTMKMIERLEKTYPKKKFKIPEVPKYELTKKSLDNQK